MENIVIFDIFRLKICDEIQTTNKEIINETKNKADQAG